LAVGNGSANEFFLIVMGIGSRISGNRNPQTLGVFKVSMASLTPAVNESGFLQVRNELPDLAGHFRSIALILSESSRRMWQDFEGFGHSFIQLEHLCLRIRIPSEYVDLTICLPQIQQIL
jgi:hypothetical protein